MQNAVAVSICLQLLPVWYSLGICLNISAPIKDKKADFSGAKRIALLNPDQLVILVDRLHAVASDADAKFGTDRHGAFRHLDHFKAALVRKGLYQQSQKESIPAW